MELMVATLLVVSTVICECRFEVSFYYLLENYFKLRQNVSNYFECRKNLFCLVFNGNQSEIKKRNRKIYRESVITMS